MREGGGLVFGEPKNASRRTLERPQRAVEALRSHRKKQTEKLRATDYGDAGLVFATGNLILSSASILVRTTEGKSYGKGT